MMMTHNSWLLCFCVFFITIPTFSSASTESNTYIVHMDLSAMPKAFSSHHSWYLSTVSSAWDSVKSLSRSLSSSKIVYSYTSAINGFSAVLSASELEAVKGLPGYVSSVKDVKVRVDTTDSFRFLGLNSSHGAWPDSGYGKDVIIGVVDTGVWPESRSFHDEGMPEIPSRWRGECESGTQFNASMCNRKLIGARYFNKGLGASHPNLTIAMNSARDTDGHGTHTSSTAAGRSVEEASFFGYALGTAKGVAPKARVAIYKALWSEGAYMSDIVAAIDGAIADGVDVLSLSLGLNGLALYDDPVAIATFAAIEKGIFVSTSAGNLGPGVETLHNGAPWVLTVAAGTIDRVFQGTLILGNGVIVEGLSLYPKNSSSYKSTLVFLGACDNENSFKAMKDKIVICVDMNNTLAKQVYYARNAKLAGTVFISSYDVSSFLQTSFPAIFLKPEEGVIVANYLKSDPKPRASFRFQETLLGTESAPKLASYSSRGPSQSCPAVLKPDIMAPGDLILASWPSNIPVDEDSSGELYNNFNIMSGTSMACPHAAGVAALLKGAHPEWSPAAIRSAMMTTAYVVDNTGSLIKDIAWSNQPATPLGMGSGHIDPNKALDPGLVYDASTEDYTNLLCALNFTAEQIKTITRSPSYNCSNPSLDLNYPSFIAYFNTKGSKSNNATMSLRVFNRTVTNVGDGSSVYIAKLTALKGLRVSVMPDQLEFRQKYEKKSYLLSIEGPEVMNDVVVHGSLTWVESNGKYRARSPIVATNMKL